VGALARPFPLCFLVFLAGLALALRFGGAAGAGGQFLLFGGVLLLVGPAVWTRGERVRRAALLAAFGALGLALGAGAQHERRTDCRVLMRDGARVALEGVLESSHFGAVDGGRVPMIPVRVAEWTADGSALPRCTPVVRVRLPHELGSLPAGTSVRLRGEWTRSPPPPVPSRWPADPRFAGWVVADSVRLPATGSAAHPLLRLRGRSEASLRALFPEHAPLVEALVLGRRERLDPAVRDRFARAGLAHLLAISGMHVGILAGVLLLIGRVSRLPRRWSAALSIGAIGAYLLFIGAPPSAVRAGTMISLALVALNLQRPFDPLGLMVAAAFGILVTRPATLLDPGFQLSFGGVLGILVARKTVLHRLPGSFRSIRGGEWLAESMVVSGAAFLATAPIVAWHFGLLAPVAVVANLPAVPLLGLSLVGVLAASATAPVHAATGALFAAAAVATLDLLALVADLAASIPFGHGWVNRSQATAVSAAVAAAALVHGWTRRARPPVRIAAAAGTLVAALLLLPPIRAGASSASELQIHVLDVGQGDAIAIRSPAGRWLLIDAGPADDRFDAGERRILPFLRAHGVHRLEAMILTHPHRDHVGGAPAILRALEVGRLVEPGHPFGSPVYLETLRTAEARGVPWTAARSGRSLRFDGVELALLWPDAESLEQVDDVNEISAVVHLRFGPFAAMFTGDAYDATEWELVRRHGDRLRAQLLKAGHHGSHTSTSPRFLDAVRPELVLVSAGRRNRFGHPAPEVLRELRARGIPLARTDRDGTLSIRVDTLRSPLWRLEASP
jgi:competence protein ComEC